MTQMHMPHKIIGHAFFLHLNHFLKLFERRVTFLLATAVSKDLSFATSFVHSFSAKRKMTQFFINLFSPSQATINLHMTDTTIKNVHSQMFQDLNDMSSQKIKFGVAKR